MSSCAFVLMRPSCVPIYAIYFVRPTASGVHTVHTSGFDIGHCLRVRKPSHGWRGMYGRVFRLIAPGPRATGDWPNIAVEQYILRKYYFWKAFRKGLGNFFMAGKLWHHPLCTPRTANPKVSAFATPFLSMAATPKTAPDCGDARLFPLQRPLPP